MSDLDRSLRQLVEEGTRAAHRPSFAELRSRARHRHRIRVAATAVAAAAAVTAMGVAVLPLSGSASSGSGVQGATPPGSPGPTATGPLGPLTASPSETIPGGTVTLDGAGCAPGESVLIEIRWDRGAKTFPSSGEKQAQGQPTATATAGGQDKLATVDAAADGSFTARVTIPVSMVVSKPGLWTQCLAQASSQMLVQHVSILVRGS